MQQKCITLGTILAKEWMKSKKLTQTDFSQILKTSRTHISRWLNGKTKPNIDSAAKIEKVTKGYVPVISWSQLSDSINVKVRKRNQNKAKHNDKNQANKAVDKRLGRKKVLKKLS